MQVRELKLLVLLLVQVLVLSHLMQVRELKQLITITKKTDVKVAPHAGA